MLIIRDAQINVLAEDGGRELRQWIAEYVRRHFQSEIQDWTGAQVDNFVLQTYRRALRLGIDSGPAICKFTGLTLMLGDSFETNAAFPWVQRIFSDPAIKDPNQRVELAARLAPSFARQQSSAS